MTVFLRLVLTLGLLQEPPRIDDVEFDRDFARAVRATESAAKLLATDPRGALKMLEDEVLPALPRLSETVLIVRFSRGAVKGAEKERHDFFPFRVAGEAALASGEPGRAVEFLKKSPGSGALLEKAKSALAEKEKTKPPAPAPAPAQPSPLPPAPAPLSLTPFLEKFDYTGALLALRGERERLGKEYDVEVAKVRDAAVRHLQSGAASVAAALPRLREPEFSRDHLDPFLASASRIPPDVETDELRWLRRLSAWLARPEPAEFDRLAIAAARLGEDYHVICLEAQKARLADIEALVERARRAPREERQGILEALEAAERAFLELSRVKDYRDLGNAVARAKSRLPVESDTLAAARRGVSTIAKTRVLASQLDLLWTSDDRGRLGDQDQKDLAMYLGIYRSTALFLEGRSVDEVGQDPRVVEVFRQVPTLPSDTAPKIVQVFDRVRAPR